MCGIAGFVGGSWAGGAEAAPVLTAMAASIGQRGPDHSGIWIDFASRVGFAHNRLAIVDLSPAGNQPMHSRSGRYVITYNGEIYNHRDLREELAADSWQGHSDTETLLAAIEAWGVRGALERCVGMFAFALWDKKERELTLARDRLGEKPLYYGRQNETGPFLFGSELKALARHPQFRCEIDRDALALYLRFNYVPAPRSIYRGISKLGSGCLLIFSEGKEPRIEDYWSAATAAEKGAADRFAGSAGECVDELEHLLARAVGQQMMSDVPLGAFLSGGIDSSAIVALMQKQSAAPVKTFSIGFREEEFDEARHASAVARHLGTEHTELYVTPAEAMAVLPALPAMYDEPFADSSQVPTYLVSRLAREQVTVSLSGDGGDELFGGYDRYGLALALWRRLSAVPRPVRQVAAGGLGATPAPIWNGVAAAASALFPEVRGIKGVGSKIHQRAALLGSRSVMELYGGLVSQWADPASIVIGGKEPASFANGSERPLAGLGSVEQMMATDMVTYLPDDILVKLDRASMAVSLESRVPLLDHRVVEFAWRIPFELKVRGGETKWVLRQLLHRHVPRDLVERPKMGFGVPVGSWLRGPLRGWAEGLLDDRRLREDGYFRPGPVRRMWESYLGGATGSHHRIWTILMFQSWLDEFGGSERASDPMRSLDSDGAAPVRVGIA